MRAPYQVLIIPFRHTVTGLAFAVLKRSDSDAWQFVSGGGEDSETLIQSAEREMREEVSFDVDGRLIRLDAKATIPATVFEDVANWGDDVYVIPEYSFAIDVKDAVLVLSAEHDELRWLLYEQARALLSWDSNRTTLWELNERLTREVRK